MIRQNTTNKFKDNLGRWLSKSLFYESYTAEDRAEKYPYMFTLKDEEFKGLPSLKQIYLSLEDPTEYRIATEYLGGWEHWKSLLESKWFAVHVANWREELEVKMKCKGLLKIMELSETTGAVAKDATKFLINREWEPKRGRPSKIEIEKQTRINSNVSRQLEDDFNNIFKLNER